MATSERSRAITDQNNGPTLQGAFRGVKAAVFGKCRWGLMVLLVTCLTGACETPSRKRSATDVEIDLWRKQLLADTTAAVQRRSLEQLLWADPQFLAAMATDPRVQGVLRRRIVKGVQAGEPLILPLLTQLFMMTSGEARLDYEILLIEFGPAAAPALLPLLGDSTPPGLALRAAETLARMRASVALASLARMLRYHPNAWARAGAAHALGELAEASAVPSLIGALSDENRDVANAALVALATLRAPEAVPFALRRSVDAHPATRKHAAHGLGEIGPRLDSTMAKRVRVRLRQMADSDHDAGVRFMASRALWRWSALEAVSRCRLAQ